MKGLMKRKTRAILMARRLSAGHVPNVDSDGGIQTTSDDQAATVEKFSAWGPAVLTLEIDKMAFTAEAMMMDLGFVEEFYIEPGTMVKFARAILGEYKANPYHNMQHGSGRLT